MTTYGRTIFGNPGSPVRVSADGSPEYKFGGVTIDWSTVAPAAADVTLDTYVEIPSGQRGLRYGTVIAEITATGLYGPYDDGASDGRQTLTRGACYILDQTVLELGSIAGIPGRATNHPAVIEGGLVWRDRLVIGGDGPSQSDFNAAFPRIRFAQ